ncbi:hypothetical protein DRO42_07855 [Candidatus Bathyarchaeota archaeon]|nr:MAG: hypothetical protein DRO42_07855 [Candidatus Bathyarchaeota archaeon]
MSVPKIAGGGGVYRFLWEEEQIRITVSRIRTDRHGTTTAEIKVESDALANPHLHMARLNLTSSTARKRLADQLADLYPVDWVRILEQLCVLTLNREREGEPWLSLTSEDEVEPVRYLLPPFLPEGEPTILYGPGGSGKSLFALLIGMLVATGKAHPKLKLNPNGAARVLYLDWETSASEIRRRLHRLAKGLDLAEPVELRYRRCVQPLADDVEVLQEAVQEFEAGLLIIDSLAPACGGDLSVPETAMGFFRALRRLNCTALVVAHPAKNSERKTIFGSVFYTNLARSVWEVQTYQDVGGDSIGVGLFHRKANLSRLQRPLGVEFLFDGDLGPIRAFPRDVVEIPEVGENAPVRTRILALLPKSGPLKPKEVADRLGASEGTVRKELARMRDRGLVAQLHDGRYAARAPEEEVVPF